ncbi:MAG: hypothetical protein FWD64_12650, partial [Acidobacteriaceae bacterium]|nr:hypothetical protein [Acidobacteriaceae bacterium]
SAACKTSSLRSYSPIAFAVLLLPVLLAGKAKKLRMGGLLLIVLAFGAIAGVVGCGSDVITGTGGGGKCTNTSTISAGTYTITVTGNDSSHSTSVLLVVQ